MKVIIVADEYSLQSSKSGKTLIEDCYSMFAERFGEQNILVECTRNVYEQIKTTIPTELIFTEPEKKGTAPAIGLAAVRIFNQNPQETVLIAYSDHPVKYKHNLFAILNNAEKLQQHLAKLLLIGVNPTFPATQYGYVKIGRVLEQMNEIISFEMVDFQEKPPLDKVNEFLQSWRYLWNTGYMLVKVGDLLEIYREHLPELYKGLMTIKESLGTELEQKIIDTVYPTFPKISIDKGIYERIDKDRVAVVPADLNIHDFQDY